MKCEKHKTPNTNCKECIVEGKAFYEKGEVKKQ